MTQFTYSEELFSDFHKDTYGFRPRGHEFYDATPERKQEIWDGVGEDFVREQERECKMQLEAQRKFETRITETIALGAGDRETAIRWILEAEVENQSDLWYGAEYFEWKFGLAFGLYVTEFSPITDYLADHYDFEEDMAA
jgi:hypothetical protein